MISTATLNGQRVTHATAQIPAWGCWYADASVDGDVTLTGAATLVIADLTLKGTIISGGPDKGRSHFRIVAGAGGWGKTLTKRSYSSDLGVRKSTVLTDAAQEAKETLGTVSMTDLLGPHWVREADAASRVLELVSPGAWYVDEAGVTQIGARPSKKLVGAVTQQSVDLARGTVEIAADSIAQLLPGVVVNGIEALDVRHEIDAKKGLRTTLWGKGGVRRLDSLRAVIEQMLPGLKYMGLTEYRVVTLEGARVNLQPVRVSTGMPDLRRVKVRPGLPGAKATLKLGSVVLVGFVDSSPSRPVILAFEDSEGDGWKPPKVELDANEVVLAAGSAYAARVGDAVTITSAQILAAGMVAGGNPVTISTPLAGSITGGSSKVKVG